MNAPVPFEHQIQLQLMDLTFRITQMADDLVHCPIVVRWLMPPLFLGQGC